MEITVYDSLNRRVVLNLTVALTAAILARARGLRRSSPCGDSPATTESPKVSTPRWSSCNARHTGFATFKTTGCELKYSVLDQLGSGSAPIVGVEPKSLKSLAPQIELEP
jgi:hypothetical protein